MKAGSLARADKKRRRAKATTEAKWLIQDFLKQIGRDAKQDEQCVGCDDEDAHWEFWHNLGCGLGAPNSSGSGNEGRFKHCDDEPKLHGRGTAQPSRLDRLKMSSCSSCG